MVLILHERSTIQSLHHITHIEASSALKMLFQKFIKKTFYSNIFEFYSQTFLIF